MLAYSVGKHFLSSSSSNVARKIKNQGEKTFFGRCNEKGKTGQSVLDRCEKLG